MKNGPLRRLKRRLSSEAHRCPDTTTLRLSVHLGADDKVALRRIESIAGGYFALTLGDLEINVFPGSEWSGQPVGFAADAIVEAFANPTHTKAF